MLGALSQYDTADADSNSTMSEPSTDQPTGQVRALQASLVLMSSKFLTQAHVLHQVATEIEPYVCVDGPQRHGFTEIGPLQGMSCQSILR